MRCPSCQAKVEASLFCSGCGALFERPAAQTHFSLFGLPVQHEVDAPTLDKRFRELSLKLHPDRFSSAEPRQRRLSLEHTSALNDAYRTLKEPVRRAFYLLKLAGVDLDREDFGTQQGMPVEFLEEVMELREALSEADLAAALKMAEQVREKQQSALAEGLSALDAGELSHASHALGRVRYFARFLEEVAAMEEKALG